MPARARWLTAGTMMPVAAMLLIATAGAASAQETGARMRPPAAVECSRDHLTVYAGVVKRYRRGAGRIELRIATDWDTTEEVVIRHQRSEDPGRWLLFEGRAFEPADWNRIEVKPGQLRADMRAAAWVCDDGRNPIVDWNPPREP